MTQDTITEIPLDQLHDSHLQPRTVYSGIDELAANVRAEGRIHSPLLVRPILPNKLRDDIVDGYEIVFGHRRRRAAEVAGLATAPCMVRAMNDAEVRSAQMTENVQRDNMSALDEGAGYKAQIDAGDATADQIAERIGKSRSHVYGRIKLLEICGPVRDGLLGGQIGSEVALLIARLRSPKLQEKALAAIRADTSQHSNLEDGGRKSFRHIRDLLAEKFTLDLKSAIFDPEDDGLLPGAGTCSTCPKRTGNAPEFADLAAPTREGTHHGYTAAGGANVCTDPDCFDAKKTAHLVREAEKLRAGGQQVVTGNKARQAISATGEVKGDFMPLADFKQLLKSKATAKGGAAVTQATYQVVTIQNPRDGKLVKAVHTADAVQAGLMKANDKKAGAPKHDYAAQQARQREESLRREAQCKEVSARRLALLRHVREVAAARQRDEFDLRLVAAAALGGVQWNDRATVAELWGAKSPEAMSKRVDTMTPAELTALLLDCAVVDHVVVIYDTKPEPGPLLALAAHYGIDAKAFMAAAVEPASTPSPAGAGAGKAKAAPVKNKPRAAAYWNPMTGDTWSGRGLRPRWLVVAIEGGKSLSDFLVAGKPAKVMDEAGSAGGAAQTAELFEESVA